MKKIPVGAAIAHAYGFAFGEFVNLLKLTWPLLVLVVIGNALIAPQLAALSRGFQTHDYSAMTMPWPLLLLAYAVMLIATMMWLTAIYQYALGRPEALQRPIYFSLAKPMWRLLGAVLLMVLSLIGLLIVFVIAAVIVIYLFRLGLGLTHISDTAMKAIMTFDTVLAFIAGYCMMIFCAVRFGFLLLAATIAEDRIGLFRSWTLSHRNFWRLFVTSLAILLPMLIVEGIGFYAFGLFPHVMPGATTAEIQAAQAAASAAGFAKMRHYWYLVYPGSALISLITYGLLAGAQSFAYRALTDGETTPSLP